MRNKLNDGLITEARMAFVEYEKLFVTRVARRPGDRMSAHPVEEVLATGDEEKVREYITELARLRNDILTSTIA
jgi:hypothetical protein